MSRRPPRSTLDRSSAASDVYKRQLSARIHSAAASAASANLRPERLKSRLTARRRASRANEFAPDGRTARRLPARTRSRPAQAGLVAARPFGPNSCGGCERRRRESASRTIEIAPDRAPPGVQSGCCLLYTYPSPRDRTRHRMPSSACKTKAKTHYSTTH